MSRADDSLEDLQAEGRRKLRQLKAWYEREQREAVESRKKVKRRRREFFMKLRGHLSSILVQALGTLVGGGLLALAGLALGLIKTTPRGQVVSVLAFIATFLVAVGGGILMTTVVGQRSIQEGERAGLEMAYLIQVERINEKYQLSEEIGDNDALDDQGPPR